MPKTTCPDCKKQTASTKSSCPRCGFPLTPPQIPRRRFWGETSERASGLTKILLGVSGLCAAILLLQD
jgi:predicted amidophosphoribosyltransferase